jgi:hypothetical protein
VYATVGVLLGRENDKKNDAFDDDVFSTQRVVKFPRSECLVTGEHLNDCSYATLATL